MHKRYSYSSISLNPFLVIFCILCAVMISLLLHSAAFADGPYYSLELSTFDNQQEAEEELKNLKNSGHNAFFRKEEGPDKKQYVYHVYIEKYETKDEAEKEAQVLKELDLIKKYSVKEIREKILKPDNVTKKEPELLPPPSKQQVRKKIPPKKPAKSKVVDKAINTGLSLRVGSFKEESNASELKAKLIQSGKKAYYKKEQVKGMGEYYRLYLMGYESIKDAVKDAKKLKNSGIITGWVIPDNQTGIKVKPEKKDQKKEIFFLHVFSLKEKKHAEKKVVILKEYDYKAFFVYENIKGKMWYRVYIGEFKDEKEARKTGAELLEKGVISYFKPLAIDREKRDK